MRARRAQKLCLHPLKNKLIQKPNLLNQPETQLDSQVTVVITVPFVPIFADAKLTRERGESAIRTFSNTLQQARHILPDGEIIGVLEQKIENQTATDGIRQLLLSEKCQLCLCDEFETVGRWYRGIRKAFDNNPGCSSVLLLPGDIEKIGDQHKFEQGLRRMITETNMSTLTVGDYTSTDPFKEQFDSCLTHPLLERTFPQSWPAIEKAGVRKVRSEYFCIGSNVFKTFLHEGWRWLPFDITMLLMHTAVSNSHLKLRRVDLGEITDTPTRNVDAATQQIVRFAFQLWFNGQSTITEADLAARKAAQNKLLAEYASVTSRAIADLLHLVKE